MLQSNLHKINELDLFLKSKDELVIHQKEFPFAYNLLLNDLNDFKLIFNIINNKNKDKILFPLLRVSNGDEILCINEGEYCLCNPFEDDKLNIIFNNDLDYIWQSFIYPYL